jgi:putative transposase
MARLPRIQSPDLLRHVTARGNGRMVIFRDAHDYRRFRQTLGEVVDEFALECWNYCLMPNHYHATIRPTLPNISAAIQALNSRYGQWWNQRHMTVGHVFQGRFKAQIVQHDAYALTLSRYVALNPVRANLVKRPEDWEWSSYSQLIGVRPAPRFLAAEPTLALFGEADRPTLQHRFAAFVRAGCTDEVVDERLRSAERIVGDAAFKRAVELAQPGGQTMV